MYGIWMMVESSSEYICNREAGTGDTFFIFLLFAVFVHLMHTFMLLVYIFKERVTSDCSFTHILHSCFAFICCFQGIGKEIIQYHLANVAQVQFHSFLLHISFLVRSSRFAELKGKHGFLFLSFGWTLECRTYRCIACKLKGGDIGTANFLATLLAALHLTHVSQWVDGL